jgi:type I restriction enzyme S subunit
VLPEELERLGPTPREGDVLLTRANTVDLVALAVTVDRDYPTLHLSDKHWKVVLRDPERDNLSWLKHVINSRVVRRALVSRATGTSGSMKNVSQEAFLAIPVARPPTVVQREISEVMADCESAWRKLGHLLAAKRRFKGGLMQELLTGKRRFKEFEGEVWTDYHLGDLFSERVQTDRIDLPLLSITGDRGVIPRDELDRRDTSSVDKSAYLRIAPGDIGYNTMRMWQGVSGLSEIEGIVSPAYTICVPSPKIHGPFAAQLFKLAQVIHLFHRYSQGLVKDTLNLKFPQFATVRVKIPGMGEQRAIAELLHLLDREITQLEQLRDTLDRQRRGVAELLLSGKVRVPA